MLISSHCRVTVTMSKSYRKDNLTPEQVQTRRNDEETESIIESMRNKMFDLLAKSKEILSDLMNNALNYLHIFWKQLFAYHNDGEYSIDKMVAERAIRPITVQRKNSMFFRSVQGVQNSAVYNTFIETCKQMGISFRRLLTNKKT